MKAYLDRVFYPELQRTCNRRPNSKRRKDLGTAKPNTIRARCLAGEFDEAIRARFPALNSAQIAKEVGLSRTHVRMRLRELNLAYLELEYWTEPQIDDLYALYATCGDREIAQLFGQKYAKKKGWTHKHIAKKRKYLGLVRTPAMLSVIKQKLVDGGIFNTSEKPWATRGAAQVGEVRSWLDNRGNRCVFIKTETVFVPYAPVLWRQHHGEVPENHVVTFIDGDPSHCVIENLQVVSRGDIVRRIRLRLDTELPDSYLVSLMTPRKDSEFRQAFAEQFPELIEAKRLQIKLNRTLKQVQNYD